MSESAVEQIIGKMLLNSEFRKLMASDMTRALSDFDLTEGELEGLKSVDLEEFHRSITGLDERVSKGIQLN